MSPRLQIFAALLAITMVACSGTTTAPPESPIVPPPMTVAPTTQTAPTVANALTPMPTPTSKEGPLPGKPLQSLPTPTLAPTAPVTVMLAATSFPDAPERDLYQLAAELTPGGIGEVMRVVNPEPVTYAEGREDTFWLIDLPGLEVYSSRLKLRLVTPHAYWYFEEGQSIRQSDIERSAALFEEEVYPRVTAAFGREWSPGVDNDPHLNILNARLKGVGGYYSSSDEYPLSVYKFSNQREVIYVNTGAIPVGSPLYLEVLAHELQHAVHWNADSSEETWINEGLSELATTVAGFDPASIFSFLRAQPTSLVNWPLSPFGSGANYGAASLFMHYLAGHYGDPNDLRPLLAQPADGIAGITAYLNALGYDTSFTDVFRDWAAANFLDEEHGPYGYPDLEVKITPSETIDKFSEFSSQIPQYAVEYVELDSFTEPVRLIFHAPVETDLLPVEVDSGGCWWGNSGDSINSTLTRSVDLRGLAHATLDYQIWYELEEDWDYAYLEVSADGGRSWDILETPHSSAENPIGNSFGAGYTGDSEGWINESVDLTPYAGQEVLLRFQYITDDAINGAGLCIRRLSIPEASQFDSTHGWRAEGFVLTDNRVRQDFIVQIIQVAQENRVTVLQLDDNNAGEIIIPAPQDLQRLVVAVAAMAPKTRQEAHYTLTVEPVS